ALAGLGLAAFLLVHVGAVLAGRALFGLDTNFHFAAAGLHVSPWVWFFLPYYAGAVVALFVHVGCALQRRAGAGKRVIGVAAATGMATATVIVGCMTGVLIPVSIPAVYLATYGVR
ncbi:MAG: hypothetical protein ABUL50_04660, partial [Rhizobacter sp.]